MKKIPSALADATDERKELSMKKSIHTMAATALCALALGVLGAPVAQAQGLPEIVALWSAGPVWNVQVVSGDEGAALACAHLFSETIQTYWADGTWTIGQGSLWVTCTPKNVVWDPNEKAFHIKGQIPEGMFANTVVTGKVIYRDPYWWDMEIHAVKGEPAAGWNGTAPAFDVTFELELKQLL
jgi:hypothetical protein